LNKEIHFKTEIGRLIHSSLSNDEERYHLLVLNDLHSKLLQIIESYERTFSSIITV